MAVCQRTACRPRLVETRKRRQNLSSENSSLVVEDENSVELYARRYTLEVITNCVHETPGTGGVCLLT